MPNYTGGINAGQSYLLYGVCLLLVMLLMPRGIAPSIRTAVARAAMARAARRSR